MKNSKITNVVARRVLDSRGNPTIETEYFYQMKFLQEPLHPRAPLLERKKQLSSEITQIPIMDLMCLKQSRKSTLKLKKK